MSQPTPGTNWGPPTTGPASPSVFAARTKDSLDALLSQNKSSTAPSYRVAGTMWLDDSTSPWVLRYWDGSQWIVLGTVNAITHIFRHDIGSLPILGTVGQTSGVPTGAIIERGSNANGEYVRFADGTQICWMNITVTNQAINSAYSGLFTGQRSWTFPAAFVAAPTVSCGKFRWGSSASWPLVISESTTSADLVAVDVSSRASGTSTQIAAVAVGRWF